MAVKMGQDSFNTLLYERGECAMGGANDGVLVDKSVCVPD